MSDDECVASSNGSNIGGTPYTLIIGNMRGISKLWWVDGVRTGQIQYKTVKLSHVEKILHKISNKLPDNHDASKSTDKSF